MACRQGELSTLVVQSLTNMRLAKTKIIPFPLNRRSAAALTEQIKARDDVLRNIRRISIYLRRRMLRASLDSQRSEPVRKRYRRSSTRRARK